MISCIILIFFSGKLERVTNRCSEILGVFIRTFKPSFSYRLNTSGFIAPASKRALAASLQ